MMAFDRYTASSSVSHSKKRNPLHDDALKRAQMVRNAQSPRADHPLVHEQRTVSTPQQQVPVSTTTTPPMDPNTARKEWRRHGEGLSQASEEKRRPQSSSDVVVRILAAETRTDVNGSNYTSYVVSVICPGKPAPMLVEHRYSDFDKLNALLKKEHIRLESCFPSKHWAGRMGNWTPSLSLAPAQHDDLVSYRKVQLDLWLVDLVAAFNRGQLTASLHHEVEDFLMNTSQRAPCERENPIDLSSSVERNLRWSNPLSFTLGSSIRQAAYTVQHMCRQGLSDSDQSIPLDLLQHAKGLCFLTVVKAGLVVSGRVGTGLVVARRTDGSWSAPSALGTLGFGWGAQVGGDITHYLIVLTSKDAVASMSVSSSVTLGAELGVAVGPVGRGAKSHISSASLLQPAYAYAHSHGLFVGMSLEGSIVNARHDLNTKFYGKNVDVREILTYMDPPRAAEPLYKALETALSQSIPEEGLRPSALFSSFSFDSTPSKAPTRSTSNTPTSGFTTPGKHSPAGMGSETPLPSMTSSFQPLVTIEGMNTGISLFDTWHSG